MQNDNFDAYVEQRKKENSRRIKNFKCVRGERKKKNSASAYINAVLPAVLKTGEGLYKCRSLQRVKKNKKIIRATHVIILRYFFSPSR